MHWLYQTLYPEESMLMAPQPVTILQGNDVFFAGGHMGIAQLSKQIGKSVEQYRFREAFENDKENELRFTEQFNIAKKTSSARLGHRFRIEQRIRPTSSEHRFRYRFAVDIPLKGLKMDIGEPYLVATTESLLSLGKSIKPMYDQRITSQIGWSISHKLKAQFGIQYRMENYTERTEHVFFILNSLVISL